MMERGQRMSIWNCMVEVDDRRAAEREMAVVLEVGIGGLEPMSWRTWLWSPTYLLGRGLDKIVVMFKLYI